MSIVNLSLFLNTKLFPKVSYGKTQYCLDLGQDFKIETPNQFLVAKNWSWKQQTYPYNLYGTCYDLTLGGLKFIKDFFDNQREWIFDIQNTKFKTFQHHLTIGNYPLTLGIK